MKTGSIDTIQSFIAVRYADAVRPGEPDDMALLLKNVADAIDLRLPPAPPSLEELMRRVAKLENGDDEDEPDEELETRLCEIETKLKALSVEFWSQVGKLERKLYERLNAKVSP